MARHTSHGGGSSGSDPLRRGPRRPRFDKRLGQHHLADGRLCRPLVAYLAEGAPGRGADGASGPRLQEQTVLEVGPGGGVLTVELLEAGASVLGWELDPAWALSACRQLRQRWRGKLRLAVADAMDIPWRQLPAPTLAAGNLPYNVATPLLRRLLRAWKTLPRGAFMVQWEVGERLVAEPGSAAYGALSVLVAARSRPRMLGRVKAGSFRPPPKVDGALVGLELRPPPRPEEQMKAFEALVFLAFGQRRKTVRNSLASGWGKEAAQLALERADIDPRARAETLSLQDFLRLHDARGGASPLA